MSKAKDGFEDVRVSRRAARTAADEDALKLDDDLDSKIIEDIDQIEETPVSEDTPRRTMEKAKDKKKKKSGKGKTALLLLIAVIVVVALAVGGKLFMDNGGLSSFGAKETTAEVETTEEETTTEAETEYSVELVQDGNADVLTLVQNYYTARSVQDTEAMAACLDESAVINTAELTNEAEFLEGYQDITTYVTDGMQEGEYVVCISYSMKFKNIETPAPGLVTAYARPDSNGSLRLLMKNDFDADIKSYVNEVAGSVEVQALSNQVMKAYQDAQDADPELESFIAALEGREVETTEAAETSPAETEAAETSAEETTTAAPTAEIKFTEVDDIQYATTQVKCRQEPSTEGEDYTLVEAGEWVHVIGTSDEWYKVITQDHITGYIKAEYLSVDKPETTVE